MTRRLDSISLRAVATVVVVLTGYVLLGWWLSRTDPDTVFAVLATLAVLAATVLLPLPALRGRLFLRLGVLLFGGLCAVLAYDARKGFDYLEGMASYHALSGPVLTFTTLAIGILVMWRILVGGDDRDATIHTLPRFPV